MSDFGKGFSISVLKYMRAFYAGYPGLLPIGHATRDLFVRPSVEAGTWCPGEIHPDLSWTHYRTLLKVERRDARDFLVLCTAKNDAMVQYVLDDKSRQIFASRYQFQPPSEETLKINPNAR